jgi:hypothetical protein
MHVGQNLRNLQKYPCLNLWKYIYILKKTLFKIWVFNYESDKR